MDNKNNRLFYWNVKDFMERKPVLFEQKRNSLKDTVSKVLNENNEYHTTNFVNDKNLVNDIHRQIERISLDEQKYVSSKTKEKSNSLSNPFYLKEAIATERKQLGKGQYSRVTTVGEYNPTETQVSQESPGATPVKMPPVMQGLAGRVKAAVGAAAFGQVADPNTQGTGSSTGTPAGGSGTPAGAPLLPAGAPLLPAGGSGTPAGGGSSSGNQSGVSTSSDDDTLFDALDEAAANIEKARRGGDKQAQGSSWADYNSIKEKLIQKMQDYTAARNGPAAQRIKNKLNRMGSRLSTGTTTINPVGQPTVSTGNITLPSNRELGIQQSVSPNRQISPSYWVTFNDFKNAYGHDYDVRSKDDRNLFFQLVNTSSNVERYTDATRLGSTIPGTPRPRSIPVFDVDNQPVFSTQTKQFGLEMRLSAMEEEYKRLMIKAATQTGESREELKRRAEELEEQMKPLRAQLSFVKNRSRVDPSVNQAGWTDQDRKDFETDTGYSGFSKTAEHEGRVRELDANSPRPDPSAEVRKRREMAMQIAKQMGRSVEELLKTSDYFRKQFGDLF